ncbi:MAG TPA: hypothetical protein VH598_06870, partial [Verrucomicrobiae bacterium]|nr:hypothetical protein [Verrucomicrobiae bacterium]
LLQGTPTPPPGAAVKPVVAAGGQDKAAGGAKTGTADKTGDAVNPAVPPTAPEAKPAMPVTPPNVAGKPKNVIWQIGEGKDATVILSRAPNGDVRFLNGFMTVVPMVFGSALCMILFSLLTPPPSRATIDKYFSKAQGAAAPGVSAPLAGKV